MECWLCKYYEYEDYRINDDGEENPYGRCTNKESKNYDQKVNEGYFGCDDGESRSDKKENK